MAGEIPLNRNGKHLCKMKKWSHLMGNYEGESLICVTSI
nr:MAG TPA: Trypsin inhibitor BWI-2c hairpin, HYDROLASE INHIBITOR [Caudoviricetes sp.]